MADEKQQPEPTQGQQSKPQDELPARQPEVVVLDDLPVRHPERLTETKVPGDLQKDE